MSTTTSPLRPRRSPLLTGLMLLYLVYTLVPLLWLFLSATKTQDDLLSSPGLWFWKSFALFGSSGFTPGFSAPTGISAV